MGSDLGRAHVPDAASDLVQYFEEKCSSRHESMICTMTRGHNSCGVANFIHQPCEVQ